MEFRILGPLEVDRGDGLLDIGGQRQEIVLAMLLLEASRIVAVDRLVDGVWPDSPPATARSQIQICVSKLRRVLDIRRGPAHISTRRPGYAMVLGDARLDLHTFQAEVAAARNEVAAGHALEGLCRLQAALGRWRGQPLAGLETPAVSDAATRLEELRISVVEEYGELALALGRNDELVPQLGAEVDRNPLRERLRAQLMLALYRSGRQADALTEFRQARRVAVEELGIEPADRLRRLEVAILRNDPTLLLEDVAAEPQQGRRSPAAVPHLLPADVADFTGRTATVSAMTEQLTGAHRSAGPSTMPIAVITGQGGIGKTALAVHVAHGVSDAFPDGQLFASMHGTARPIRAEQALERFLRALGVPGPAIPETLDERAELYRDLLINRRVLVVLDDLSSETQATSLLPAGDGCAVLMTSRRRLTGVPGAARIELPTFSPQSAMTLLGRVIGQERVERSADSASELVRLCGYLPLAVRVAAARLAARPHWSISRMVDRLSQDTQLDELRHGEVAVRASLLLTYESLAPEVRRLLRLVSLIDGPDFGAWACAAVLDLDVHRTQDLLDELVEMYVVDVDAVISDVDVDTGSTRYRLHDLVRLFARERAVAEEDTVARTDAITRYVGALLHLAEQAHRREYGGDFLIVHGGAARYVLDATLVDDLLARPLDWLAVERAPLLTAVAQAAAAGLTEASWDLAISTVALYEAHAHFDDWRESHELALSAARRGSDPLGEAMMLYSLGSLQVFEQQFLEADRLFAAAIRLFTELDCPRGLAMVERNRAFIDRVEGRYEQARTRNDHALAIFRKIGDRAGEAHVLSGLAQIDIDLDRDEDALAGLHMAAVICEETRNRRVKAQVMHRMGEVRLRRGEVDAATAAFATVLEFARSSGDRTAETYGLVGLGSVAVRRGDLVAARQIITEAEQLAAAVGEQRMQARTLLLLSDIELADGNLCAARGQAEEALRISTRLRTPLGTAAGLAQLGDVLAAGAELDLASESWAKALDQLRTISPLPTGQLAEGLAERLRATAVSAG